MLALQAELSRGMARRAVGATSQNEHSSRSHAVVRIELVVARPVLGAGAADETMTPGKPLLATQRATLQLVDLAGAQKTYAPGYRSGDCDCFSVVFMYGLSHLFVNVSVEDLTNA